MVAATARISTTDATRAPIAASAQSKPLSADCTETGWAFSWRTKPDAWKAAGTG
jgi:hypothetical protein